MNLKNVTVLTHPLVKHNLAVIRNKDCSREIFLSAFKRLSYFLMQEGFSNLPTKQAVVSTPLQSVNASVLDDSYTYVLVPILRAGLALMDVAVELLPNAHVLHVGVYRDEKTCKPVWYYNKTPNSFPLKTKIFILDPMLATGGSALSVIDLFVKKGIDVKDIVFISLLSAPEGIKVLQKEYPDLKIITASIDDKLNENAYILPGLGDAGDRYFNSIMP